MFKYKSPLAVALMLSVSITFTTPASAYAASLDNLLAQTTKSVSDSSSGNGIYNILMGLLLGKLLGNATSKSDDLSKVLGLTNTQASNQASASGSAIIATGQKYMGVPYVWGGETPNGFDCSGFTQFVMKQNGVTIPRTAAEQFAAGTPVAKNNLKVGDLVFFTTYKPGASHVGFYMGDGKFIHASSAAKQVAISSLDEQYYVDHYVGARSYIK
ncbi:C40 family peptidase [Dendrosporobacter sp. 1207_IL3150]|uniref:C40 family peptidase n=1 Tax=Dendrosporobacter sp. 1207_IL3150 TaxID=3084054 RepID=UPI002FDADD33